MTRRLVPGGEPRGNPPPETPGFYLVHGIENMVSQYLTKHDDQPAFWTGQNWIILGWDAAVPHSANLRVMSRINA